MAIIIYFIRIACIGKMTSQEQFVERLKLLAPPKELLKSYQLPDEFINELIQSYNCAPKFNQTKRIVSSDGLINLLNDYNCSHVKIGIVSFENQVIENRDYYLIGHVELDLLILNKISLQIEVRDHDSPGHVLWACALNGTRFLDALLLCADLFSSRMKDLSSDEDVELTLKRVKLCADAAGGVEYIKFYKMLLGYFD